MPKDKGPEWNHVTVIDDGGAKESAFLFVRDRNSGNFGF